MADITAPQAPPQGIPAQPAAQEDVSRKTIVVLLILVTILSTVGTFAVLNELWTTNAAPAVQKAPAQGYVKFTVLDGKAKPISTATAHVAFEVKKNENE